MIFAETGESISGGNFHGEYPVGFEGCGGGGGHCNHRRRSFCALRSHCAIPSTPTDTPPHPSQAKSLDYLAIGIHELASISERRIERLVNPALSGLPAFLVNNGGLHSGFMIAHCTAASLVSENKVG